MMSKRIRVFMIGNSPNKGGVETYVQNLCNHLENDFEIIHRAPKMVIDGKEWIANVSRRNPLKYIRFWNKFYKENKFDVIYFNNCDIVALDALRFATKAKIPIRIFHAHNTAKQFKRAGIIGLLHKISENNSRKNLHKYATHLLACSQSAGDYMFNNRPFQVIKNGIDLKKYEFNKSYIEDIKRSFNIKGFPIFCSIGRLSEQKNPLFCFEIFKEICLKSPSSICLFIGDGSYKKILENRIKEHNLENRIHLLGNLDNIHEWLSYSDALVMPSLFEGLPFALVEAQASGLHALVSDTISFESNLTGLVEFKSLKEPPAVWADRLIELAQEQRINVTQKLIVNGYSIEQTAIEITSLIKNALT